MQSKKMGFVMENHVKMRASYAPEKQLAPIGSVAPYLDCNQNITLVAGAPHHGLMDGSDKSWVQPDLFKACVAPSNPPLYAHLVYACKSLRVSGGNLFTELPPYPSSLADIYLRCQYAKNSYLLLIIKISRSIFKSLINFTSIKYKINTLGKNTISRMTELVNVLQNTYTRTQTNAGALL